MSFTFLSTNDSNSGSVKKIRKPGEKLKEIASKWKKMVSRKEPTIDVSATESEMERKELEQKMQCRPPICLVPIKEHADLGLSLSGCGFLGTYHFGVVKCFIRNGQPLISRLRRLSGASAGSLVAAMLLLAPNEIDGGFETMCTLADELNTLKFGALSPGFYLAERLIKIVDKYLPEDISRANHRLFVSVTHHKTRENRLVSEFESREYLIKCLNASCYIPMYSMGMSAQPPEIEDEPYIDGGYSNNLPDFSDLRTITVSPFTGSVDISPSDPSPLLEWNMMVGNQHMKVNLRNIVRGAQALFPPSRANLQHYYSQGYKDAFKFLIAHDLLERQQGTSV